MSETGKTTETDEGIYDEVADQLRHTVDANREQDSEVAPATLLCAVRNEAERLSSTNEKLEFILENLERCFGALKAY